MQKTKYTDRELKARWKIAHRSKDAGKTALASWEDASHELRDGTATWPERQPKPLAAAVLNRFGWALTPRHGQRKKKGNGKSSVAQLLGQLTVGSAMEALHVDLEARLRGFIAIADDEAELLLQGGGCIIVKQKATS